MFKQTTICVVLAALVATVVVGCADKTETEGKTQWTYTVKQSDSDFEDVSKKVFGYGLYADDIAAANPGVKKLTPGQELVIPEIRDQAGESILPRQCDRKKIY